jgi:hypothetical protein
LFTLGVLKRVGDPFGNEEFLNLVPIIGSDLIDQLSLASDDFGILSITHEFEVDLGLGAGYFHLGFIDFG